MIIVTGKVNRGHYFPLTLYQLDPITTSMSFACAPCKIQVTITNLDGSARDVDHFTCPLCRTFYAITSIQPLNPNSDPPRPIKVQGVGISKDLLDFLYQIGYSCTCVGPKPQGIWCRGCRRLLNEDDL